VRSSVSLRLYGFCSLFERIAGKSGRMLVLSSSSSKVERGDFLLEEGPSLEGRGLTFSPSLPPSLPLP